MESFVTTEELKWFYNIDRQIFTRMVVNLGYETALATKLIALWIWTETMGFPNMVFIMLREGNAVLRSAAEEGAICIRYIEEDRQAPQPNMDLPMTTNMLGKRISLGFFHENKVKALSAISRNVHGNLRRAFEDIVEDELTRRIEREMERARRSIASIMNVNVASLATNLNATAQPWNSNNNVPQEDRTMFVTFSRGYPVAEGEVTEFFRRLYGNCVEGIQMEEVPPPDQPLFALVVFRTASMIPVVLNGQTKAKFVINGKHVWMRKFIPKHGRA